MEAALALGGAVDLLFTTVVDATKRVAGFTSHLKRLESTLSSIKPAIDDTEKLNIILDRPRHETEAFTLRLMEADSLIRKCSKVRKWNIFMRFYYSIKLSELEASLVNFFQFNVAALHLCETKRISAVVRHLQERVNEIATLMRLNHHNHIHMGEEQGLIAGVSDQTSNR